MKKYYFILIIILISGIQALYSQNIYENPDIDRLVERGIKYERENNIHEAMKVYRQVLELDDKNFLALIRLAKLPSWTENVDEAITLLDRLEKANPEKQQI